MMRVIVVVLMVMMVSMVREGKGEKGEKARHLKWEVGYVFQSPDCEEKMMIGINGKYPGPTIRAKEGDTIVVHLKNNLPTEGVVIHWHGIRQACLYSHPSYYYYCYYYCYYFPLKRTYFSFEVHESY